MDSSVGRTKKAALSPFELSFLEFCSRKRSFGERISNSDTSYFYKCEFCPGKKLRNEDELEEHLDTLHTERTCSECGGNFATKKAFDAHQHHTKSPSNGPAESQASSSPPPSKEIKSSESNSKDDDDNLEHNPSGESEEVADIHKSDLTACKGQFIIFDCTECQESFPTQFHLSTHIRDSHSIPQCSLPPKKRTSPLKNWSPKSDEKGDVQDSSLPATPNDSSVETEPKLETKIDSPQQKEHPSPRKRRKKATDIPPINESSLEDIPARRNRARKNYTDIDLYLDESEEEAILQKILRQTSRIPRGRKSKNEYAVNNNSVKKSNNESITHDTTSDSMHKRDSLSTRGRRRGRCKKV